MAAPYGETWPISTGGTDPTSGVGSDSYLQFFKVAYSDTIRMKSQRLDSQLAAVFEKEVLRGNPLVLHFVKRVEEGFEDLDNADAGTPDSTLEANTNRAQRHTYSSVPTETREILPSFWTKAQLFDPRDERGLMRAVAPDSNFQAAVMGAFNRKIDKIIIRALEGAAIVDGSSTSFVDDGGLTIGVNSLQPDVLTAADPDTTPDITLVGLGTTKLLNARNKLELGEAITPGERLVCILSPRQHLILLSTDTKIANFDYNAANPLGKGAVSEWLGMDFIVTTAVEQIDASGKGASIDANPFSITTGDTGVGGNGEYVYVCTRDSMVVGIDPVTVKFDILPQFQHSLQVAHYSSVGAVRTDGAKVVKIQCATDAAVS